MAAPEAIPCQVTGGLAGTDAGEQPLPDGQRERQDGVRAHGERDAEVAQAPAGFGGVLGGLPGPAGHHEQVGGRAEQDRDRVAARRPQAVEFAGGGIRGAGYFGHE